MDTNIQKYMAFIKTIEYGSFTKAAEMLNYSQSGISRMIATLEKEWNVSLLDRSHSGVRLTSDGMMLYQTVQRICSDYENLQMQIDDLPEDVFHRFQLSIRLQIHLHSAVL